MIYKITGDILNSHEKFFSKLGFNYLLLAILIIVFGIILSNIIGYFNKELLSNINFTTIISSICNYILPFPIFFYFMKKIEKQSIEKTSINLKTFIKYIFITIALMWIGNIVGQSITMILGSFMQHNISNPIQSLLTSSDMWLNLVLISIIAPIFEEIIFRKILVDRTIKYGVRVSIIFSATIFALFHGNLNQFFYAFLMGGFFSYVYAKTGKIEYTIILHMAINFLGSVVSQFAANSMQLVESGTGSIGDITFSIIFIFIYVFALLITLYTLFKYKKYKFNGIKTQIPLKNPIKTMFINYGMICFITFFLIRIFQQILS